MEMILYRHGQPLVSVHERIAGADFAAWVQHYNDSGIYGFAPPGSLYGHIHSSTLRRSIETAQILGKKVTREPLLREAEIPLLRFPPIRLQANVWLVLARMLWMCGFVKDCESMTDAGKRVASLADRLEELQRSEEELILVGHGWINRMLRSELMKRGYRTGGERGEGGYLGRTLFIK